MLALADAALDAVARAIADVKREAAQAESLRAAEHRAFMAEQRETLSVMRASLERRLVEVRDGRDGKDGEPGPQGEKGDTGPQGEIGPQGESGTDGAPGEEGDKGDVGERGETGEPGAQGEAGANGIDGAPGERGEKGDTGERGEVGEKGDQGPEGPAAYVGEARGLFDPEAEYRARDVVALNGSAFMAKIDNPGQCPGEGWMLLAQRGKRGDKGDRGEKGLEGKAGKDGAQPVGLKMDAETMEFRMILDNGEECAADFYPIAQAIRGE